VEKFLLLPISFVSCVAALSILLRSRKVVSFRLGALPFFCAFTFLSFPLSFVGSVGEALVRPGTMIAPCLLTPTAQYWPLLGFNWAVALWIAVWVGKLGIRHSHGKVFVNASIFVGTALVVTDCLLALVGSGGYVDNRRCLTRFRSPHGETEVALFSTPEDTFFTVLQTRGADGIGTPTLGHFVGQDGHSIEAVYDWSHDSQLVALWDSNMPVFGYDFLEKHILDPSLDGPWLPIPSRLRLLSPEQRLALFDGAEDAPSNLLYAAAIRNDVNVVAAILSRHAETASSDAGCRALQITAHKGSDRFVALLLDSGTSPNCVDKLSDSTRFMPPPQRAIFLSAGCLCSMAQRLMSPIGTATRHSCKQFRTNGPML